ncbi:MAG: hypothetical protein EOM25_03200 [Deltaproteobacteria bacterium]|nr:hypothetical protein [Deltaproteobacteria bacterium]
MKKWGSKRVGSWLQVAAILVLGFFFAQGGCDSSSSDSDVDNAKYYGTYTIEVKSADKEACVGNRLNLEIGGDMSLVTDGTPDELKNRFYIYAGKHTTEYTYVTTKSGKTYTYTFKSDGKILEMTQEIGGDWKYTLKLRFVDDKPTTFTAKDDNRFNDCGNNEGEFWKR